MHGVEHRSYIPPSPALSPKHSPDFQRRQAYQQGEQSASFNYQTAILTELSAPPLLEVMKESLQSVPINWNRVCKKSAQKLQQPLPKVQLSNLRGTLFETHVIDVVDRVAARFPTFIHTNPFLFDPDSEAVSFSFDQLTGNLVGKRNVQKDNKTNQWEYDKVMYVCDQNGKWQVVVVEAKLDSHYSNGYGRKAMSPRYINDKIGPLLHLKSDYPDQIAGFSYLLVTTKDNINLNSRPSQQTLVDVYKGNIVGTSFTEDQFSKGVQMLRAL